MQPPNIQQYKNIIRKEILYQNITIYLIPLKTFCPQNRTYIQPPLSYNQKLSAWQSLDETRVSKQKGIKKFEVVLENRYFCIEKENKYFKINCKERNG
ncbi:hypothetical protein DW036_05125 [Bacteroides sp. AF39-11AC]|nr:hypothetical protein DW036_05125 [Bacteroides sp. AF39-11AC]